MCFAGFSSVEMAMDRRWDPVRDLIRPQKKDLIALSFEHNHEIRREIDEIYVSDLHFQSGFFFYQSCTVYAA